MTVRQCPEPSCPFVTSDTAELIAHRNSHEVVSLFKDPAAKKPKRKRDGLRKPGKVEASTRKQVFDAAAGVCQAQIHHDDCPQHVDNASTSEFVVHHVQPRSRNGAHTADNLILVWNGITKLGCGGCHALCHSKVGRVLGTLKHSPDDPFSGIGLRAALALGFIDATNLSGVGLVPEAVYEQVGWWPEEGNRTIAERAGSVPEVVSS